MKISRFTTAAALCAAAAFTLPSAASAQKLETGKWKVAVTNPGGEVMEIALDVSEANGATKGTLSAPFLPTAVDISAVKIEGRTLTFNFDIEGNTIKCTLERTEAGGYGGPCTDSVNAPGRFDMTPPSAAKGSAAATPGTPASASASSPASSPGARLQAGKWTGTVNHPSLGEMAFDFDVPATDNGKATMNIPSLPMTFNIEKLKVDGKKVTFAFTVEGQGGVRCELNQRDDMAYAGSCVEDGGETSAVVMKQPAKG